MACAFAGALAVAIAAAPAQATFPGKNGKLAWEYLLYGRDGTRVNEIQVFGNGKVRARITPCQRMEAEDPTGDCAANASFSPNGKRLAFDTALASDTDVTRLATAGANGVGRVVLPKLTGDDSDPAFAPDGQRLVFTGRAGRTSNLYVVGADGQGLQRLTDSGGTSPAWSSTGQIAFCSGGHVWRMTPSDPARNRVAKGCFPDWSPSGRSIAYQYKNAIYRIAARAGAARKLVRRKAGHPVFSPDGKRIAFQGHLEDSIFTIGARTGRNRNLIRRGGISEGSFETVFRYYENPAWQPLPGR